MKDTFTGKESKEEKQPQIQYDSLLNQAKTGDFAALQEIHSKKTFFSPKQLKDLAAQIQSSVIIIDDDGDEQINPEADPKLINNLGYCYNYGIGTAQSYGQATEYYEFAIEKSNADAMANLGILDYDVEKSEFFQKIVDKYRLNNIDSLINLIARVNAVFKHPITDADITELSKCSYSSYDVPIDEISSSCRLTKDDLLRMTVKVNDFINQLNNKTTESKLLLNAAELGNMAAMDKIYEVNKLTKKNNINFIQQCAAHGHVPSMRDLSADFFKEKNYNDSTQWLEKAAKRGDLDSMVELGYRYEKAVGVKKNEIKAAKWYEKAANSGNLAGMYEFGRCLGNGTGTQKDCGKAISLLRAAELRAADNSKDKGLISEDNLKNKRGYLIKIIQNINDELNIKGQTPKETKILRRQNACQLVTHENLPIDAILDKYEGGGSTRIIGTITDIFTKNEDKEFADMLEKYRHPDVRLKAIALGHYIATNKDPEISRGFPGDDKAVVKLIGELIFNDKTQSKNFEYHVLKAIIRKLPKDTEEKQAEPISLVSSNDNSNNSVQNSPAIATSFVKKLPQPAITTSQLGSAEPAGGYAAAITQSRSEDFKGK